MSEFDSVLIKLSIAWMVIVKYYMCPSGWGIDNALKIKFMHP